VRALGSMRPGRQFFSGSKANPQPILSEVPVASRRHNKECGFLSPE
jgi:hypothetical protein